MMAKEDEFPFGSKPIFRGELLNFRGVHKHTWVFPKIGIPQNGWFVMENPIKIDDLGVPLFSETPTSMQRHDMA